MTEAALLAWDPTDLESLLRLQAVGASTFRSRHASANARGTVFGGQLIGQAVMAASMTVADRREPTVIQSMFLQSASPARPIDFEVTTLQEGKRFASRHVRASQAGERAGADRRVVFDAQVSFAVPLPGPDHATPSVARRDVDPQTLPTFEDLPAETADAVWRTLGYPFGSDSLDLRLADPARGLGLDTPDASLRFWLRARRALPDDPALQAAAFGFATDWWTNFTTVGLHVTKLLAEGGRLHVASLNHAIWFHRPLRADGWLHFDVRSPSAARGRGLSIATVHDASGVLVASVTQENLMTPGSV